MIEGNQKNKNKATNKQTIDRKLVSVCYFGGCIQYSTEDI